MAHKNAISTATPTFSGSSNSRTLLWMLSKVSGGRISKMVTAKLVIYIQIHIRNAHSIAQLLWHPEKNSNGYPNVFGVLELKESIANSARCNRKSVLKMAAAKPEVVITQLLDKKATPIQRL